MMNGRLLKGLAAAACLVLAQVVPVGAGPLGPTPYLSFADSPYASVVGFTYFNLETFEDHLLNAPGVTGNGVVTGSSFGGTIIDSVRNDGLPTGPCPQASAPNPCDSYFSGSGSVTFTFNGVTLGGLPTHVGLVWTDGGGGTSVTFSVAGPTGPLGSILGTGFADNSNFGETAEDRFFGWTDPGGILSITMSNSGGIEVDHLQYGRLAQSSSVPEPGTMLLLTVGAAAVAALRRRF